MEYTSFMAASVQTDLKYNQNRNVDARISENFRRMRSTGIETQYDLQTHAHHNVL